MSAGQTENASLNPNDILTAEFAYIAQTAFQANEDRARVTNFYLVTLGGFIAALFSSQAQKLMVPHVYWAFAALFVVLSLASILTLLQLVRLREAWFDSVQAMNEIKGYYQGRLPGLELDKAFAWKTTTLPAKYKPWSVGFLLALQVALLGGASAGAAVVFVGLTWGAWLWGWAVVAALVCLGAQMVLYRLLLRKRAIRTPWVWRRTKARTAARR
jgi:hypothetical protein